MKVIAEGENGVLTAGNNELGWILYMLYHYGEISYHHTLNGQQRKIDELINQGALIAENKFFSRQEADYLSYIIDNSHFSNSLGIRNKYLHGIPTYSGDDAGEKYLTDYLMVLLAIIVLILRINEELSLKYCFKVNNR